jgi:hypothetical protein
MTQQTYKDPHGLEAWYQSVSNRCFVTLVDADLESLASAQALTLAKSIAELAAEKGEQVLGPDGDVTPVALIDLGPDRAPHAKMRRVSEGER